MWFRIRTIMIAVVIVGLVTASLVLWSRARDEIRRASIERALAENRAVLADKRAIAAEIRRLAVLKAMEVLQRPPHVDGDQDPSQKPPTRRPNVAQ